MGKPSVSVTISNYNHGHFLADALDAILSQSYRPLEVLIIDDASTDNSVAVIEAFARRNPTVRLIRNTTNAGTVANSQRLFSMAAGDYIYSTAADDRVLPGFLEQSAALLERYPNAGLCFSDPATFVETKGPIRENRLGLAAQPTCFGPQDMVGLLRRKNFQIAGHTSLVRKDLFLQAGGLLPALRWHCDWFAMWVLAFRYGACYVPAPLATLRVVPNSFSNAGVRQWQAQIEIMTRMLELLDGPYSDVATQFRDGGVSNVFGSRILWAAGTDPRFRKHLSSILVRRALGTEVRRTVTRITPESIKGMYRPWNRKSISSTDILHRSDR